MEIKRYRKVDLVMVNVTFKGNPVTLVGEQLEVGDEAPNFKVINTELEERTLSDYEGKIKLISVVPSVDTGVCALQTKRFNEEADKLENVQTLTISMDLPFAQARWCSAEGVKNLDMLSDHREADFGKKYGVLMEELRLLARSIFVVNEDNKITYVEYVPEVGNHPDYEAVLQHIRTEY